MQDRRSIGQMPVLSRHLGLSAVERCEEKILWSIIVLLLQALAAAALVVSMLHPLMVQSLAFIEHLIEHANSLRGNFNRGVDTFTDHECWKMFRFRKLDLTRLLILLLIPAALEVKGGRNGFVQGEYAFLLTLHRLSYPQTLENGEVIWGKDYSYISKVFNTMLDWLFDHHRHRILGNLHWYSDRFDHYNQQIQSCILQSAHLLVAGEIPANLAWIFGFLDGSAKEICRPGGPLAIQNAMWNGYHHGHFLIWQGVSFPDGMLVLEGPFPGYQTDTMVWRDCHIRDQLEEIMQDRLAEDPPRQRLRLYADKIYNTSNLVVAAWSNRHGPVADWQTRENSIMSGIRIAVEWTFGTIVMLFAFCDYCKGQRIFGSPVAKQYTIASFLANCHCCLYGDEHTAHFNCRAPTLEEYLE